MDLHILLPGVLLPARFLGEAFQRMRMSTILGEILAGVILGPALLGFLPSELDAPESYATVQGLAQVGLCALLFRMGLETRFKDFLLVWRRATLIAIVGIVLCFTTGWGLMTLTRWPQATAIVIGATLTATSISVTASLLSELKAQASPEGILILSAALVGDIVGLIALSALTGASAPVSPLPWHVFRIVLQSLIFIGAGLLLGLVLTRGVLLLSHWATGKSTVLVLAFSYFLLIAYTAKLAGLTMVIGAYAAGLAFAGHRQRDELEHNLSPLVDLLRPLFFVLVGSTISLSELNPTTTGGRRLLGYASALLALAIAGKLLSAVFLRATLASKLAIGSGLVARGGIGFVFAQIGLAAGFLNRDIYSAVALVLAATTVVGPVLFRITLNRSSGRRWGFLSA